MLHKKKYVLISIVCFCLFFLHLSFVSANILPNQTNEIKKNETISIDDEKIQNNLKEKHLINVEHMTQENIPSGCEAISALMLLNFFGYKIDSDSFIEKFLIKQDWEFKDKKIYAADPNIFYIGNPYIKSGINCGFGAYANCLKKSINNFLKEKNNDSKYKTINESSGTNSSNADENHTTHKAFNLSGMNLSDINENYINKNIPVMIWITKNLKPTVYKTKLEIDSSEKKSVYKKGDTFSWPGGEHCVVLCGSNENSYFVNDPLKEIGTMEYPKKTVEKRFLEQGKQAVFIKEISLAQKNNEDFDA